MMTEQQAMEMFDQELDQISSPIEIAGVSRPYSYALKEMDPIAYDCAFADWACENQVEGYY